MNPNPILFENDEWLVVNKPTGISTHGAYAGDLAMQEWIALHWAKPTFVCSRLDKETSGVLVLAKTAQASGRAQQIHEDEAGLKEYHFISRKDVLHNGGVSTWQSDLALDGVAALTQFERLEKLPHGVLYRAAIRRGRKHQIRRHAAGSGVPILGDTMYGGDPAPRIFLHCTSVSWPEIEGTLQAPLPPSFQNSHWNLDDPGVLVSLDRRGAMLRSITQAFRCLHRGESAHEDCAIDIYGTHLCVWSYDEVTPLATLTHRLTPLVTELAQHYQAKGWVLKRASRNPHNNKLVAETCQIGEPPPSVFFVEESGLRYEVSLTDTQHVGLFLDQRDNRKRVRALAAGKRVANLFSFTCSFSVAALAGGAEVVFSVDAARKWLNTGCRNIEENGLNAERRGKFVEEDVRKWLERQQRKIATAGDAARFGVVICDPPTFSSTKEKGNFSVEKEWKTLALACRNILSDTGLAFFSTNHRAGTRDVYRSVLEEVFASVEPLSPPMDFPRSEGTPEHVKLFLCRVR